MKQGFVTRALVAGGIALGAASLAMTPAPASARVSVGIGFGVPLFAPAYPAPVYAYPPGYYAPSYAPAPAYAAPPPVAAVGPSIATNAQCRQYSTTQIIAGAPQQVYGTACRQPDGSWRIMD